MSEGFPQGNEKLEFMGEFYQGQWMDRIFHGQGTIKFANGIFYYGEWSLDCKNKRNGKDIIIYAKGGVSKGNWKTEN